ncbi:MAG: hypothetical protein J3R72DRAFT_452888 [Linnemannia gamsii]|nr:MAG: hypothetical protein J3R72DRAFT_452888 [Linnemannia gamsii]
MITFYRNAHAAFIFVSVLRTTQKVGLTPSTGRVLFLIYLLFILWFPLNRLDPTDCKKTNNTHRCRLSWLFFLLFFLLSFSTCSLFCSLLCFLVSFLPLSRFLSLSFVCVMC